MNSQFAFASCQPGAENALKKEVEARIPGWKFSFSRPGFVTFKMAKTTTVDKFEPPRLTFARTVGLSFDRQPFNPEDGYSEIAKWILGHPVTESLSADRTPAWHVWQRDDLIPGEKGFEPGANDATRGLQEAIEKILTERKEAAEAVAAAESDAEPVDDATAESGADSSEPSASEEEPVSEGPASEGPASEYPASEDPASAGPASADPASADPATVEAATKSDESKAVVAKPMAKRSRRNPIAMDAILVEPDTCWIGAHAVRSRSDRWPGGVPQLELPENAISRAYLKMQEGLRWAALPTRPGDEWIELGCAPGGASQALLDNGMFVTGIDPAEVDPLLFNYDKFRHLQMRTMETPRSELVGAQWLAADVNAAPSYTLEAVGGIVNHATINLRGLLLTIKLLSEHLGDPGKITEVIKTIRSWGYSDVRVRQLAHNRREYCVAALKSRGQRRMARKK